MVAIEVRLTQPKWTVIARVVQEDETTRALAVSSLNMRGAQREVTRQLTAQGYVPVGRWAYPDGPRVSVRRFRR